MSKRGYKVSDCDGRRVISGLGSCELRPVCDVKELVDGASERFGDKVAFKYKVKGKIVTKSYKDLKIDVDALGTSLIKMGLKGASIAVMGENRYEWGVAYFSIINGTGRGVPLDKHLPVAEIVNLIERSGVKAIFFSRSYLSAMKELSGRETTLEHFICFDEFTEDESFDGLYTLDALIKEGRILVNSGDRSFVSLKIDREEPCILLFTSGTTSASKGVMLCHRNIAANVTSATGLIEVIGDECALSILPLHHTFENTLGMMFMIHSGVCIAYCEGIKHIAKNLKEFEVSWMIGVPAIFEAMAKQIEDGIKKSGQEKKVKLLHKICRLLKTFGIDARRKLLTPVRAKFAPAMRVMASGAAPIDKKVIELYENLGIKFLQGYGLTETSPLVAATMPGKNFLGTVGYPVANVSVTIDSPDENGMGELLVKGDNVMLGYYDNSEATEECFTEDGWFKTGDLAKFDEHDAVMITGRAKSMIVFTNGKKAFPEEYEFLINKIPGVRDSFAWGCKAPDGDIQMCAKILTEEEPNQETAERIDAAIKAINADMPRYKMMRYFIIGKEPVIRNTTLKIKRPAEQKKIEKYLIDNGLIMRKAHKSIADI